MKTDTKHLPLLASSSLLVLIRPWALGWLLILPFALSCGAEREESVSPSVVTLASSPAGGAWFAIGGVLAHVISDAVPDVRGIAEVTGGAVENVRLVGTGQSDIGFVILKIAQQGYRGEAPFRQAFPDLRMLLANFQIGLLHLVVLEDSPLENVCDLKGVQVAVGPSGHGSIPSLREIFSSGCGFTFEEITPAYLPYNQSLTSLGDRRISASALYIAPPVAALSEFGATHSYRLLPLSSEAREKIVASYPYYVDSVIPAGLYEQVTADVPTVGTPNGLIVNAKLADDLVYEIVKAFFENLEQIRMSHPTLMDFGVEDAARGGLIPFHEGAIRYYREQGVWTEPHGQESKL